MRIKELVIHKGIYSASRNFATAYKYNKHKVTYKTENYKHQETNGGIITLSTSNKITNTHLTLQMYRFYDEKIYNKEFCTGCFLGYGYFGKQSNLKFDKNSSSVEVNHLDLAELLTLAKHLIKKLCAEGAVVKDYNSDKIYIIEKQD